MTNSKSTKRTLISGALAILMCTAMLIGTTFAWFTDTASTAVNKIQAGNLAIQLLAEDGVTSIEGKTLEWQKAAGTENETILWEPGCTYKLLPIIVKNAGSLALKYKIQIANIDGDAKLNEAIIWTVNGVSFDEEKALSAGEFDILTIEGHMMEDAGNEYQGLSIDGVVITVVATQLSEEKDSYDEKYDKDAKYPVINTTQLKTALTNGGIVAVAKGNSILLAPEIADKNENNLVPQTIVTNDTTINLEGKIGVDLTAAAMGFGKASPVFMSVENGTLTINGNGELNCEAGNEQVYGINVNGGNYYGAITAIQVQRGSLEINGGGL